MKTLTNAACSEWLASWSIPEAPYDQPLCPTPFCEQFPLPDSPLLVSHSVRRLVEISEPFGEALLHFTDWPLYQPDEMAVVTAIRAAHGEPRPLIEAPGHLFAASERDLLIGLLSLAVYYRWTAYLYFDHRTTFLCWEGELLDFWTFSESRVPAVREIFQPDDDADLPEMPHDEA